MKIGLFLAVLILTIFSCSRNSSQNGPCEEGRLNGYTVPYISLTSFEGKYDVENEVVQRIKNHLLESNIVLDTYFVSYIGYPDTTINCNFLYEGKYYLVIDLVHELSKNYLDSIAIENKKLENKHRGEEWIPIIPPPTGNISGKDRAIFYYFEGDSIVNVLSQ